MPEPVSYTHLDVYKRQDVPKVFTILMEYIQLASEAVVAVFLCVTLLLVDFKMTVVMGGILVFMTLLIMRVMKNRLNSMGPVSYTHLDVYKRQE